MGRQVTNGVLVLAALAILFFGGSAILSEIGYLPQEFIDVMLQSMFGLLPVIHL